MPLAEMVLASIVDAVVVSLFEQTGVASRVRDKLGRDPIKRAFSHAFAAAFSEFEQRHPTWQANLFDASFFAHEGAPVLVMLLQRDGQPSASDLAERWADSLRIKQPDRRGIYIRELEPAAADFLELLSGALKQEEALAELNDSRAFEQLAADLAALRTTWGAGKATPGTRRDYLHWLIERNTYLDPRGTLQTQRQVQLKLDEIYVSLQAQRDDTADRVDKRLLEAERAALDTRLAQQGARPEEIEDARENLEARLALAHAGPVSSAPTSKTLELAEAVKQYVKLVFLGDPGSGKTTLVRYLALKHATALQNGLPDAGADLGPTQFPIFIRVADYAEGDAWRNTALSDFLSECCGRLECPRAGLADLLASELAAGNCLVVLDGLDEIVDAGMRLGVVKKIEAFVQRHDDAQNRFIITSRIAGYRSAPLNAPFVHYTIQDMGDEQIKRFLERWCNAVEAAQTPDLSAEARAATAQREIDGILQALERSPGVRRLAANPLLLRVLALIHRTGAQLPQKRIELYKLAADTLARTWRPAQGVAESVLVKDEFLTPMLGALAYWMHVHKPTGIATESEVYNELGKEWTRIKRLPAWDPDDPNPDIVTEIKTFLQAVREHTGLFVERAPKRYGFLHLTFEEYYAARHLVRQASKRAKLIRQHICDPRWQEPILLGLGFVGMDYPDDAAELLESAVLARGEEAEAQSFTPSKYEDILGRDFLFALRCLGDQIPVDPRIMRELIDHLVNELIHRTGSGRWESYRKLLYEQIQHLAGSAAGKLLIEQLKTSQDDPDPEIREQLVEVWGKMTSVSPNITAYLIQALVDPDEKVRATAAGSLRSTALRNTNVRAALLHILNDPQESVRAAAARTLSSADLRMTDMQNALLSALNDSQERVRAAAVLSLLFADLRIDDLQAALFHALRDTHIDVHANAAIVLAFADMSIADLRTALISALHDTHKRVRLAAVQACIRTDLSDADIQAALLHALNDSHESVRAAAAQALGSAASNNADIQAALLHALNDSHESVRAAAILALRVVDLGLVIVQTALLHALSDPHERVRAAAAQVLRFADLSLVIVQTALLHALSDPHERVRAAVAQALGSTARSNDQVRVALLQALTDSHESVRAAAALALSGVISVQAQALPALCANMSALVSGYDRRNAVMIISQEGDASIETLTALIEAMLDDYPNVPAASTSALVGLARRFPAASPQIELHLLSALTNPSFEKQNTTSHRIGQDYVFEALWQLMEIAAR